MKKNPKFEDMQIKSLKVEKGRMELVASHSVVPIIAKEFVKYFKEQGGVNYLEVKFNDPNDPSLGTFDILIQRTAGKTPAQKASFYREALQWIQKSGGKGAKIAAAALKAGE